MTTVLTAPASAALPDKVDANMRGIAEWLDKNMPPDRAANDDVVLPECHSACGRLWTRQQALDSSDSPLLRQLLLLAWRSGIWAGFYKASYGPVGDSPHYVGNRLGVQYRDNQQIATWLGVNLPTSTASLEIENPGDKLYIQWGSGGDYAELNAPTFGWKGPTWAESASDKCDGEATPPPPSPQFVPLSVPAFCYWWNETTQHFDTITGGVILHAYFAPMTFDGAPRATPATYAEQHNFQDEVRRDPGLRAAMTAVQRELLARPNDYRDLIAWMDLQLGGPGLSIAPDRSDFYGNGNPAAWNLTQTCAGDPVNCATGNFSESYADTRVPGRGLALDLTRTYNSQLAAASGGPGGPFGPGWSATFFDHLSFPDASTVVVHHSNGSEVVFRTDDAGSSFFAGAWVESQLSPRSDGGYTYTLPDRTVMVFDSMGQLRSETDVNGNQTSMSYVTDELTTVTDPGGRHLTFTYNSNGTIATVTDQASHQTTYSYTNGELTGVTDPAGQHTSFAYGADHQITSITDPRGNAVATNTYDAQHRVVDQADALGHHTTWDYTSTKTTITQPSGAAIEETFENSVPTRIVAAAGTPDEAITSILYDDALQPVTVTDPDLHQWSYDYDARGNRSKVTDPLDHVTKYVYDVRRQLRSITRPDGHVISMDYDGNGNVQRRREQATSSGPDLTWSFGYNNGQMTVAGDPLWHSRSFEYDNDGNLRAASTPAHHKTTYGYDADGFVISQTTPRGNTWGTDPSSYTTTTTRDDDERPITVTAPGSRVTTSSYDANGNLTDVTDADDHHTHVVFDALNRPTEVHRPDGTVWSTSYDVSGNVASQTDGTGHTTSYGYDRLGRVTSVTDPLNRLTRFSYDAAGHRTSSTDALGHATSSEYDAAGRLTDVTHAAGSAGPVHFAYDAVDRRTSMTDDTGTTTYNYDDLGRLLKSTAPSGQQTTYTYDDASRLTGIEYPYALAPASAGQTPGHVTTGTVTRTYDEDDQLRSVADWLGHTTSFTYDDDGNLATTTRPNGVDATYGYSATDALTSLSDLGGAQTLTRTGTDLLHTIADPGGTSTAAYDGATRLTGLGGASYAYDDADNLTQLPVPGGGARTQHFDVANQLTTVTQGGQPLGAYAYDDDGQRTAFTPALGAATALSWDRSGNLMRYTGPDRTSSIGATVTQSYTYDGDGLRQSTTTAGTTTFEAYDLSGSLPVMIEDGGTSYITGPGGLPIEQITANGTVRYFSQDQLGSTTALTDSTGATVQTYTYDAYGQRTSPAPTVTNPFQFAGQYTDAETGLQYLRARYYDPESGQFLSRDPLEAQTRDPYAYAGNDPLNATDPTGLDWLSTLGDAVGSVVPTPVSDFAAKATDFLTGGAASDIACNGLTLGNGLTGGANLALSLVPGGRAAGMGERAAVRSVTALTREQDAALVAANNPNKLLHVFGKVQHNLAPLKQELGGQEAVMREAVLAIPRGTTGAFEVTTKIGRYDVTIRGRVIDGVPKIGTMFAP